MKCAWKVLAVCLLLQSVCGYLPLNNESEIPEGAKILKENAETLFGAIFNPTQRKELSISNTIDQDILQEVCADLYVGQVESIMYVGGYGIRNCVRINNFLMEIYMKLYGVEQIQQQFLEGIQQCSVEFSTSAEVKCYTNLISQLFRELNSVSEDIPHSEQVCLGFKLQQMLRKLAKAATKYERCLSINSSNNSTQPPVVRPTWVPPRWNTTQAPPQWNSTWAPPQWNSTWAPPQWNSTWPPSQWNSTWAPPQWNSTWTPPNWNTTWVPPQWNSTWTPPQWNSTWAPPQWNSTWASPNWNSTWAPPIWNSTWAPPQWNSTWASPQWNSTWAPPQWNSTWTPPQWNTTEATPQWNTTSDGNSTQASLNTTESTQISVTTESNAKIGSQPWGRKIWHKIENIFH